MMIRLNRVMVKLITRFSYCRILSKYIEKELKKFFLYDTI